MEQNQFFAAALAEEKRLLAELASLEAEHQRKRGPVLRKLEATRSVKAAFGADPELDLAHPRVSDESLGANSPDQSLKNRENSHKAKVIAAAESLLASGAPMRTPQLLEQIEARGVVFSAANKAATLSVILSKDDRFVSDRRAGWSLAQKNPQDAATSAGSLADMSRTHNQSPHQGPTRTE